MAPTHHLNYLPSFRISLRIVKITTENRDNLFNNKKLDSCFIYF